MWVEGEEATQSGLIVASTRRTAESTPIISFNQRPVDVTEGERRSWKEGDVGRLRT